MIIENEEDELIDEESQRETRDINTETTDNKIKRNATNITSCKKREKTTTRFMIRFCLPTKKPFFLLDVMIGG